MSSQPKRRELTSLPAPIAPDRPGVQPADSSAGPVPSDTEAERRQRNVERNQAAIALIESWRVADAALTPEEQRRAQEEWEALQREDYLLCLAY